MTRVTLDIRPGLVEDDTAFTVGQGGYVQADKVRFWRGFPEVIGGWESVTTDALSGVCRGLFTWRDNNNAFNLAMGTHTNLYVNVQGDQADITPTGFVAGNEDGTGGQGYGTGTWSTGLYSRPSTVDTWPLTWSFASYGQTLIANPRGQTIFQWANDQSAVAASLGRVVEVEDDFTSYADNAALDVEWTRGTGWSMDAANDQVDCDGTQTGETDLDKAAYALTVNKWYRVEVDFSNRSAGAIRAFGDSQAGEYSEESEGTVSLQFKAANASADVGARGDVDFIGSVDAVRVIELNAPDEVTCVTVPSQKRHVVAFGCNEEATNTFNARAIRWCDFEDLYDWATLSSNNAGEHILDSEGYLIGAREAPLGTFVWTTADLWNMSYLGQPGQTYLFDRLGTSCGLIGPNGAVVFEGVAYWMSPDGGFWQCQSGGLPQRIVCPLQDEVSDNLAFVQQGKVYAASISEYREIWWFYPDARDGNPGTECSRYVSLSLVDGSWSSGQLPRTAYIDAGSGVSPVAVDPDGGVFYQERGESANGGAFSWSLTSGDIYIQSGDRVLMVQGIWPDIMDQRGAVSLEVSTKAEPQNDYTVADTLTLTPGQDRAHFRSSGRIMRLKWSGEAAPTSARIGRINVEVVTRGRR